jgi:hypothetical protein
MKKLSWLLVLLCWSWAGMVFGQMTDGGNFVVGASLGLSSANSKITQDVGSGESEGEGPVTSQFSISPKVGYFIIDQLAIGIGLDYTRSLIKEPNEDRNLDSDLLFGPFARYYLPVANDAAIFLEGSFGFGNATDNLLIGGQTQNISTNIFAIGFGPGLTVFSDQGFGISAIIKYNYARSDFDTDIGGIQQSTITKTNQFDFSVGIAYYFSAVRTAARPRTTPGY